MVIAMILPSFAGAQSSASGVSAATAVYVREDSDHTTVIAPRLHLAAPVSSDTRLDLVYTADVWSSASIDIRSAATKRVVEQRDEIDLGLSQTLGDVSLSGAYRYSSEHDYTSHGGSLNVAVDLARHSTTVAASVRGSIDRVGKAGDPWFDRQTAAWSGRASLTQVTDTHGYIDLVYELARHTGYLSSPYRYVRIADASGPMLGTCVYPSTICERENNPNERVRHAAALHVRRAIGDALSLGAQYRFYVDDWHVRSHTVSADLKLLLGAAWLLGVEYRYYTQTAAAHYRAYYALDPLPVLRTSDKELSPLHAHRLELELSHAWVLDAAGTELRTTLLVAPAYFAYDAFPWLHDIRALESTFAVELRL